MSLWGRASIVPFWWYMIFLMIYDQVKECARLIGISDTYCQMKYRYARSSECVDVDRQKLRLPCLNSKFPCLKLFVGFFLKHHGTRWAQIWCAMAVIQINADQPSFELEHLFIANVWYLSITSCRLSYLLIVLLRKDFACMGKFC